MAFHEVDVAPAKVFNLDFAGSLMRCNSAAVRYSLLADVSEQPLERPPGEVVRQLALFIFALGFAALRRRLASSSRRIDVGRRRWDFPFWLWFRV